MNSGSADHQVVRFGTYEADLAAGRLLKGGVRLKLQEQPFQVLAALLEKPGELVTRDELKERLWSGDTFVDFDRGLNTAVNKIREVLGDSAQYPRYVETQARRGYRFIAPVADERAPRAQGKRKPFLPLAALTAGLALGIGLSLWVNPGTRGLGASGLDPALRSFWRNFTQPTDKTIAIFSNALYVGDVATGLRHYNPEIDRLSEVKEFHTGVGELVGVFELGRLFQLLEFPFEIKRAALADWDEVKKANVIFIGGPSENLPVRELRRPTRFVFEPFVDSEGQQRVVIVDRRPPQDGPIRFDAGGVNPIRRDYAIIRMLGGFAPKRRILLLAGLTTLGTQSAVEFVCRTDKLLALTSQLERPSNHLMPPFECVIEVGINGGVPIDSRIVAIQGS